MDLSLFADHPLYALTSVAYAIALALYLIAWKSPKKLFGRLALALLGAGAVGNGTLIALRWIEAGRPPFKSLFESMVFLAFCIATVCLVMGLVYRTKIFAASGAFGALGVMLFALTKWDAEIVNLPPALQSAWFVPHVVVYFLGYGALFFATAISIILIARWIQSYFAGTTQQGQLSLDDVAYSTVRFAFVMLTFGMLMGSFWAKSAWGDYWVWDPKENWSLATWLVFAGYLHLRQLKGWRGVPLAILCIIGFGLLVFTFLGMERLPSAGESAHVYMSS